MAGRRRPILWSPEAEDDLADIWNYYADVAGRKVAETIIRNIGAACRVLEDHPFAGRERNEIRPGLRSAVANPYIIFYRAKNDTTEIVRVLDGRRDIEEIFSDE